MVFITHTWEKNSDMMNTGFWVSIGETGQQQEKNKTVNFCQIKKIPITEFKKTVCYKKRISYLEFIRSMLF